MPQVQGMTEFMRRARRDEGRGRPRLCSFETSALTLFWKVYILFFVVSMMVRLFPFLASAVKMGFCVCQPLQNKMDWGKKAMLYVSMSQTTLCHTLLFSHLTASMNRSIHAVAVARTIRTYDLNSSFTRFRYFLFLPCDQDVDHQQSLTNRPP